MRLLFSISMLCAPAFTAAELAHSLGVDFTNYDDQVVGQNSTVELDTLQYGLNYWLGLESGASVTLSGWQSDADEDVQANALLEREQQGLQLGTSLPSSLWFSRLDADANYQLAFWYAQSSAETLLRSKNDHLNYREDADSWSFSTALSRDWRWQSMTVSPSLGLSYEAYNSSLLQRLFGLEQQIDQEEQGWSAEAGISLAYDIEPSEQSLWSPYLTLNWYEPLTLDSALSQTSTLNRGSSARSQSNRITSTLDEGGSGVYTLGLLWLWHDWSTDLSWSDSWSTQTDTNAQLRFGVSRSF